MTLDLFAPGSTVMLGEIPCQVTGITIRENSYVQYQVSYWVGGIRYEPWVSACEVNEKASNKIRIGFLNNVG